MINITDVRIRHVKSETGKLKAMASVIIDDCIAIHDIKILSGENGTFIAMPSRKTPEGTFRDIAHPINSEARTLLTDCILAAYEKSLAEV